MFKATYFSLRKSDAVYLDYIINTSTPRPRVISCNGETYRYFWPFMFCRRIPVARPFCRWLARNGTSLCGALSLRMKPSGRLYVAPRCGIKAGTALISLPRHLSLEIASQEDKLHPSISSTSFEGRYDALVELTSQLVRHLHDLDSPFRRYAEFLADIHNIEGDEEDLNTKAACSSPALQMQLDDFYAGNVLHPRGIPNAPFLAKKDLESPSGRLEWVRLQRVVRSVEQSIPHFGVPSVGWALSMVLSRSVASHGSAGRLAMFPLIDFSEHSYSPNSEVVFTHTIEKSERCGVRWHDSNEPCVHLRAIRGIRKNEPLSVLYSSRPCVTAEDRDYWKVHYGFIPPCLS